MTTSAKPEARPECLSDFWRYDLCDDRARELDSILQGADALIGNMGSDMRVVWAGGETPYTDFGRRVIALDYGPLLDKDCPFPGESVDEVIGCAAHEGGHCLWSHPGAADTIRRQMDRRWLDLPPDLQEDWLLDRRGTLIELCHIQNILEDVYVDHFLSRRWPVLGEYVRLARRSIKKRVKTDLNAIAVSACPTRIQLVSLWTALCLYEHKVSGAMSPVVARVTGRLEEVTRRAMAEPEALARQAMALDAAACLWSELAGNTPPPQSRPVSNRPGQPSSQESPTGEETSLGDFDCYQGVNGGGRRVTAPPPPGARAEDAGRSGAPGAALKPKTLEVVRARPDAALASNALRQVRKRVAGIQKAFQQHNSPRRWHTGLDAGRLDNRRLWKAVTGGPTCYKRRDSNGMPSLAVGLLLDISESMGENMNIVEQAAALFSQGLKGAPGTSFAAWAYSGQRESITLSQICDHRSPRLCLGGLERGGGTPSGPALNAAMPFVEKLPGKRKLLIHVTDGRPDNACDVAEAVRWCRRGRIEVYAIGICRFHDDLLGQYGPGNFETILALPEMPQALFRLVMGLKSPAA